MLRQIEQRLAAEEVEEEEDEDESAEDDADDEEEDQRESEDRAPVELGRSLLHDLLNKLSDSTWVEANADVVQDLVKPATAPPWGAVAPSVPWPWSPPIRVAETRNVPGAATDS